MTGFGKASGDGPAHHIAVEARSVNHRHLEVVVRLREPFRAAEARLRGVVAERVGRGRVDLAVEISPHADAGTAARLRSVPLLELAAQVAELAAARPDLGLSTPGWGDLLRVPDMVVVETKALGWAAEDERALEAVAATAVDAMVEAREREGRALAGALGGLTESLRQTVVGVAAELPSLREQLAERTRARLQELLQGLDKATPAVVGEPRSWLPEALACAERSDVTEELDRLAAHLDHFSETLAAPGPTGRRLDFLVQELLRELQTLGAKCRALEVADRILEAKLITERLREQVQNVE
jgi:uncharacterized protein (TIGR00255 family)